MGKGLAILIFLGLVLPFLALAQGKISCPGTPCPPGQICIQNPLCAQTFEELIEAIIDFLFTLALVAVPLLIIIGAFFLLTSGGEPAKIKTGKNIIIYTLIGLAIILLAKALIAVIESILGVK